MREKHPLYERMGRFLISEDDLRGLPDWLQQMMHRVIVLRAQQRLEFSAVEFTALCPEFNRRLPACVLDEYRPVVEGGRFLRFEPGMGSC